MGIVAPCRERLQIFNQDVDGVSEFVDSLAPDHASLIMRIGPATVPLRFIIPPELRDLVVVIPGEVPRVCLTVLGRQIYRRILASVVF